MYLRWAHMVSIQWELGLCSGLLTPISSQPMVTNIQERFLPVLAALTRKYIVTKPKLSTLANFWIVMTVQ